MLNGDELHAEFGGLLGQATDDSFAMSLLAVLLALVDILLASGENQVDHAGELVSSGRDVLGLVRARTRDSYAPGFLHR